MKRKSVFVLILALCLIFSSFSVPAAAAHTEYITNPSGRTVNVRQGPGKEYVVDVELKPGTKVTVESIEGTWTRITSPVTGYVMSKYLNDKTSSTSGGGVIASTMTRYIYSPNGKKVNLRHGPSATGYGVAAQLEGGTKVDLLQTLKDGWSAINYNGSTVYVMSKYLSTKKNGPSSSSSFKAYDGYVFSGNGKKVNYRVGPDIQSNRLAQLDHGTSIEVIGQSGGWYRVRYGITTGYIMKQYVRAK